MFKNMSTAPKDGRLVVLRSEFTPPIAVSYWDPRYNCWIHRSGKKLEWIEPVIPNGWCSVPDYQSE